MKIKHRRTGETEEISGYIRGILDGSEQERGKIEIIEATSDNCAKLLSNLVDMLREKDIITDKEIHNLLDDIY